MKAYISVFKLRLINGLQYRAAAFAGVATQFFWGIMHIMIYEAFIPTLPSFHQCRSNRLFHMYGFSRHSWFLLHYGSGITKSSIL